ncbi:MAG: MXAN_5187 C-terminal domain-containing protein, partial [Acidobacteriota bacterium]
EEGRPHPGLNLPRPGPEGGRRRGTGDGPRVLHQQLLQTSDQSEGSLRGFYDRFLEIRRSHGQPADRISFATFERQVLRKSEVVRTRASCDAVRLRLTLEGDRVHLRAIPVRRRNER